MKPTRHTSRAKLMVPVSGALALLFSSLAFAQDQASAFAQDQAPPAAPAVEGSPPTSEVPPQSAPEVPPTAAPGAPPTEVPPGAVTEPPADAAATGERSVEDRLSDLEGKVEGISEPFSAVQTDVSALKKLKFSGYVQGRWEKAEDSDFGLTAPNAAGSRSPRNRTAFGVRRARLKTTYTGTLSEYVLQIDATPDGVSLRDAEASLVLGSDVFGGRTNWSLKLTLGQFKVPFGFEVLQSSSEREFPERTRVVRALFPGERDRGLRLQFAYDIFKLHAALINGIGIPTGPDAAYGSRDQTTWKDLVGRASVDLEFLVLGVSGYWGHYLWTGPMDYRRSRRVRYGADVQFYVDVPQVGGLTLRGEVIAEDNKFLKFAGVQPNECLDHGKFGWYAAAVQNIGDHIGVAIRFDQYDPTTGIDARCRAFFATSGPMSDAILSQSSYALNKPTTDKVTGLTVALLGYISGNLKATLAYERIGEQEAAKKDNDIVTVQLQAKF